MLALAFVLCDLLCAGSAAAQEQVQRPNIVLFLADDLGFSDTAPYGGEVATPTISELAARGVTFTNHHTAASCAPTRGMLLTGIDSHLNGVPNIPESIPPVQAKHANYRGTLNHNVVTIATLLKDAGYHTYMAGKWHLGKSPDLLPSQRGFERTIAMADTGSDNWEQKPYLPMYKKANWFADGKELTLPDDYYSSKYFVDKTIEFIESNRADGKPFFSYVPFLAVHMPVQAPQSSTDKYLGRYDAGWEVLRVERLERAKALGVVPRDTTLAPVTGTPDWDALSDEDKAYDSKKMAVYAGMIDAMDHHMGRLIGYLRDIGQYDNTVFVFMSDNGPEASDVTSGWRGVYLSGWFRTHGYNTDYDKLGTRGSFVALGTGFGVSAASPLSYYKWFAHDGGMRVPLIIAGAPVAGHGRLSNAFTFVTDLAPTILEIAGVEPPNGTYGDREIETMRGKSLLPLLTNEAPHVHAPDEPIGYELGGNSALFRGDYKIVTDRGPIGDGEWHLFNFVTDPSEAHDLKEEMPELFTEMLEDYRIYARDNQVLPIPDGYDQREEVIFYTLRNNPNPVVLTMAALLVLLVLFLFWRGVRRVVGAIFVVVLGLGVASSASAGGYEFPGDGARAIGRGGAFAAKADDPMAVVVNPAGLASMPGTQLWFSTHIANAKDCFDRNQPGVAADGTTPTAPAWPIRWGQDAADGPIGYTEICNEKSERLTLIPSLGVTWRVSKRVGMGFTIVPPNSGMSQRWGGGSYDVTTDNGSTRTYQGYVNAPAGSRSTRPGSNSLVPLDNGQSLLPSSARFQVVERHITVVYPTIAVGAKPFRWLQIGAAFGWGIADVRFINNIKNAGAGEEPSVLEGQADLRGQDWFAPRVSASLHFIPHDNVDVVGVIRWDDAIRAKGDLTVAVPGFDNAVASGLNSLEGKGTLVAPRPWWVTFGVRYADRVTPRPADPDAPGRQSGRVEDTMTTERWDLELNLTYEKNSVVETLDVVIEGLDAEQGSVLIPPGGINTTVQIGHHWQDQLSLRFGGDWNVLPAKLAVRGGFSYETNGFTGIGSKTSKGGFIDFLPLQRFGLHLGLTGRIKRAEITGAFTYFWHTTHNNGNGGTEQVVVTPVGGGAQLPGDTVNNGAYSSRIVVGSIAFRYFFKGWGGRTAP